MSKRQELYDNLDLLMDFIASKHEGATPERRIVNTPIELRHAASEIWTFIDIIAPQDGPDPLAPAWVTMDGMTPAFRCWLPGERWNGWDCPWFGEIELRQLAHHIRHDAGWNGELIEQDEGKGLACRWLYVDHDAGDDEAGSHYLPVNATHKNAAGEDEAIWDFSNGMCWLAVNR